MNRKNGESRVVADAAFENETEAAGNNVTNKRRRGQLRVVEPTTAGHPFAPCAPCLPISPGRPATVTIYPNARATTGGETVVFESLADLRRFTRKAEQPGEKEAARLYARALVEGAEPDGSGNDKRLKRNLVPPFLVILDVDGSDVPLDETVKRLELMGIACVAHSTWSHGTRKEGKPGRHCYRVLIDQVAETWEGLEVATRELFELAGLKDQVTRESWHSPCFFVPATPDERQGKFKFRTTHTDLRESSWKPKPFDLEELERDRDLRSSGDREASPEDEALVLDALPHIPNDDREDWIKIGMALRSSGLENARDIWDEWSAGQDYAEFSTEENEKAWASFDDDVGDGVGIATILHMARQNDWKHPRAARDSALEDFADYLPIEIRGGHLVEIVDEAEAALLKAGASIYQRGGALVRPAQLDADSPDEEGVRRKAGALVLLEVKTPWLIEAMAKAKSWIRLDQRRKKKVPVDPKPTYAQTLLARAGEWRFPALRAVVNAPTIDRDGRLIQALGYDAASGLLLDFEPGTFPTVPESPTKDEAAAALERLARPLRAYKWDPSAPEAARSAALSAMLAAVARPMMRTCPLHAFDAPTAGSGKSILAACVGLLAMGVSPAAMSQGKTEDEDEKRLSTVLAAGDQVIVLDNCDRPLRGDFLCSMLTEEFVQARILGVSERRIMPSTALVLATGNNLIFEGDVARRVVRCRIDPEVERPDTRRFDFDPRDEVRPARPELVAAALTVLRAFHAAGRPGELTPFGSFPDFDLVRGALVWLGWADPAKTRDAIVDADPVKDSLAFVMDKWEAAYGAEAVQLVDIDRAARGEELRERLVEEVPGCVGGTWNAKAVGKWLTRHAGRVVGGRRFVKAPKGKRGARWILAWAEGPLA